MTSSWKFFSKLILTVLGIASFYGIYTSQSRITPDHIYRHSEFRKLSQKALFYHRNHPDSALIYADSAYEVGKMLQLNENYLMPLYRIQANARIHKRITDSIRKSRFQVRSEKD